MEKLMKIQQELKVPKSKNNSYAGFMYRSCEDILEKVKPLLKDTELVLTLDDEIVSVGDRCYVRATATLLDGNTVEGRSHGYAREAETKKGMDESQITGSASSYARKYALAGLFLLDDGHDADAQDNSQDEYVSDKQVSRIQEYFDNNEKMDKTAFLAYIGVDSIEKIRAISYNKTIVALEKKRKALEGGK